jgi:DNA-binding SARP family transcriptional activator
MLFGTLHIRHADETVIFASAPLCAILGYLALHSQRGQAVLRERLVHYAWPQLDEARGRRALSSTLHRVVRP